METSGKLENQRHLVESLLGQLDVRLRFLTPTNSDNGLVPDRHPSRPFSSVAAVGFG